MMQVIAYALVWGAVIFILWWVLKLGIQLANEDREAKQTIIREGKIREDERNGQES